LVGRDGSNASGSRLTVGLLEELIAWYAQSFAEAMAPTAVWIHFAGLELRDRRWVNPGEARESRLREPATMPFLRDLEHHCLRC
jgi:hypothetical protein